MADPIINIRAKISGVEGLRKAEAAIRGLGKVPVGVKIDLVGAGGAKAAIQNFTKLDNQAIRVNNSFNQLNSSFAKSFREADRLGASLNRAGSGINDIGKQLRIANKETAAASKRFKEFSDQIALSTTRYAAFAVASGILVGLFNEFNDGITQAIKYQKELNRFQQVGGDTATTIKSLSKEIRSLSTEFGTSSTELAQTAVTLRQAGFAATEVQNALDALAKSTLAPNFDRLEDTVEGLIAVNSQFNISLNDSERALSKINAVAGAYAVEASDLITSVQKLGGAFSSAGGSFEELLGIITAIRSTTRESADTIATGLRTILARTQRSTTIEELGKLGINLRANAEEAKALGVAVGSILPIFARLQKISSAAQSFQSGDPRLAQIQELVGGIRQLSKTTPIINNFNDAVEATNLGLRSTNTLTKDAILAQKTLDVQLKELRESFLELFEVIGENKVLRGLIDGFISVSKASNEFAQNLEPLVPLILALAGTKAINLFGSVGGRLLRGNIPLNVRTQTGFGGSGVSIKRNMGGIVPGPNINADIVNDEVPAGTFILNRKATGRVLQFNRGGNVERFNRGGMVPVKLTPGELKISPRAVKNIGLNNLQLLNSSSGKSLTPQLQERLLRYLDGIRTAPNSQTKFAYQHNFLHAGGNPSLLQGLNKGGLVFNSPFGRIKQSPYGKFYNLDKFIESNVGQRTRLRRLEVDPLTGEPTAKAKYYAKYRQSRFLKKFNKGGFVHFATGTSKETPTELLGILLAQKREQEAEGNLRDFNLTLQGLKTTYPNIEKEFARVSQENIGSGENRKANPQYKSAKSKEVRKIASQYNIQHLGSQGEIGASSIVNTDDAIATREIRERSDAERQQIARRIGTRLNQSASKALEIQNPQTFFKLLNKVGASDEQIVNTILDRGLFTGGFGPNRSLDPNLFGRENVVQGNKPHLFKFRTPEGAGVKRPTTISGILSGSRTITPQQRLELLRTFLPSIDPNTPVTAKAIPFTQDKIYNPTADQLRFIEEQTKLPRGQILRQLNEGKALQGNITPNALRTFTEFDRAGRSIDPDLAAKTFNLDPNAIPRADIGEFEKTLFRIEQSTKEFNRVDKAIREKLGLPQRDPNAKHVRESRASTSFNLGSSTLDVSPATTAAQAANLALPPVLNPFGSLPRADKGRIESSIFTDLNKSVEELNKTVGRNNAVSKDTNKSIGGLGRSFEFLGGGQPPRKPPLVAAGAPDEDRPRENREQFIRKNLGVSAEELAFSSIFGGKNDISKVVKNVDREIAKLEDVFSTGRRELSSERNIPIIRTAKPPLTPEGIPLIQSAVRNPINPLLVGTPPEPFPRNIRGRTVFDDSANRALQRQVLPNQFNFPKTIREVLQTETFQKAGVTNAGELVKFASLVGLGNIQTRTNEKGKILGGGASLLQQKLDPNVKALIDELRPFVLARAASPRIGTADVTAGPVRGFPTSGDPFSNQTNLPSTSNVVIASGPSRSITAEIPTFIGDSSRVISPNRIQSNTIQPSSLGIPNFKEQFPLTPGAHQRFSNQTSIIGFASNRGSNFSSQVDSINLSHVPEPPVPVPTQVPTQPIPVIPPFATTVATAGLAVSGGTPLSPSFFSNSIASDATLLDRRQFLNIGVAARNRREQLIKNGGIPIGPTQFSDGSSINNNDIIKTSSSGIPGFAAGTIFAAGLSNTVPTNLDRIEKFRANRRRNSQITAERVATSNTGILGLEDFGGTPGGDVQRITTGRGRNARTETKNVGGKKTNQPVRVGLSKDFLPEDLKNNVANPRRLVKVGLSGIGSLNNILDDLILSGNESLKDVAREVNAAVKFDPSGGKPDISEAKQILGREATKDGRIKKILKDNRERAANDFIAASNKNLQNTFEELARDANNNRVISLRDIPKDLTSPGAGSDQSGTVLKGRGQLLDSKHFNQKPLREAIEKRLLRNQGLVRRGLIGLGFNNQTRRDIEAQAGVIADRLIASDLDRANSLNRGRKIGNEVVQTPAQGLASGFGGDFRKGFGRQSAATRDVIKNLSSNAGRAILTLSQRGDSTLTNFGKILNNQRFNRLDQENQAKLLLKRAQRLGIGVNSIDDLQQLVTGSRTLNDIRTGGNGPAFLRKFRSGFGALSNNAAVQRVGNTLGNPLLSFALGGLATQVGPKSITEGQQGRAGLAGALTGAGTGALLGSAFGPIGSIVGGLGGALIGATRASKDFEEQLKRVAFDKTFTKLGNELTNIVARDKPLTGSDISTIKSFVQDTENEARRQFSNTEEQGNFLTQSFGARITEISGAIQLLARSPKVNDLSSFINEGNNAGGDLIRAFAQANSQTIGEAQDFVKEQIKNAKITQQNNEVQEKLVLETIRVADLFDNLANSINVATIRYAESNDALRRFSLSLPDERTSPNLARGLDAFGVRGAEDIFNRSVQALSGFSSNGFALSDQLSEGNRAAQVLPDIIRTLSNDVQDPKLLNERLGQLLGKNGITGDIRTALVNAVDSITIDDFQTQARDPRQFSSSLISTALPNLDRLREVLTQLDNNLISFADNLTSGRQIQERERGFRNQGNSLQNDLIRQQISFFGREVSPNLSRGQQRALRSPLSRFFLRSPFPTTFAGGNPALSLSSAQLNAPFLQQQSELTGFRDSRAINPSSINRELQNVLSRIEEQENILRETPSNVGTFEQLESATRSLETLRGTAFDLESALKNLANASIATAGAQEKLAAIEQERSSRLSFAERFIQSNPLQRRQIVGSVNQLRIATRVGLDRFNPQAQSNILNTARSIGSSTTNSGLTGNQIAEELIQRSNVGNFANRLLGGPSFAQLSQGQQGAQAEIIRGTQTALEATRILAQNTERERTDFFNTLEQNQAKFLADFREAFRTTEVENRKQQINNIQLDNKDVSKGFKLGNQLQQQGLNPNDAIKVVSGPLFSELRESFNKLESLKDSVSVVSKELNGSNLVANQVLSAPTLFGQPIPGIPKQFRGFELSDSAEQSINRITTNLPDSNIDPNEVINRVNFRLARLDLPKGGQLSNDLVKNVVNQAFRSIINEQFNKQAQTFIPLRSEVSQKSGVDNKSVDTLLRFSNEQIDNLNSLNTAINQAGGTFEALVREFDSQNAEVKRLTNEITKLNTTLTNLSGNFPIVDVGLGRVSPQTKQVNPQQVNPQNALVVPQRPLVLKPEVRQEGFQSIPPSPDVIGGGGGNDRILNRFRGIPRDVPKKVGGVTIVASPFDTPTAINKVSKEVKRPPSNRFVGGRGRAIPQQVTPPKNQLAEIPIIPKTIDNFTDKNIGRKAEKQARPNSLQINIDENAVKKSIVSFREHRDQRNRDLRTKAQSNFNQFADDRAAQDERNKQALSTIDEFRKNREARTAALNERFQANRDTERFGVGGIRTDAGREARENTIRRRQERREQEIIERQRRRGVQVALPDVNRHPAHPGPPILGEQPNQIQAINNLNQAITLFSKGTEQFTAVADAMKLHSEQLQSFTEAIQNATITVESKHRVEVVHNGVELFQAIKADIRDELLQETVKTVTAELQKREFDGV